MRTKRSVKRENLADHLAEEMLALAGKTRQDAEADKQWRWNFSITQEQYIKYRAASIKTIKRVLRCNTDKAEHNFEWFYIRFGVRVLPTPTERKRILHLLTSYQWEE